jgi:hypothetical protein
MKKVWTAICRTKSEYNSNSPAVATPPQSFSTLAAAKAFMRSKVGTAASFGQVLGPSGVESKLNNPAGT